jgi:nucleolar protein 56
LENIFAITENKVTGTLSSFLTTHLPATKSAKKQKFMLGICEPRMGQPIFEATGVTASHNESIVELIRGIRTHFHKILKKASEKDINQAQLGLGHSFSRQKCQLDVNRQDKPIMQAIALIEQLDKNINTFCMRLKEWFSWHFPELQKIVNDNMIFTKLVHLIGNRDNATEDLKEEI